MSNNPDHEMNRVMAKADNEWHRGSQASGTTDYGFDWGPVRVERLAAVERRKGRGPHRVMRIQGPSEAQDLEIYISPSGTSIRVFRNGTEMVEIAEKPSVADLVEALSDEKQKVTNEFSNQLESVYARKPGI